MDFELLTAFIEETENRLQSIRSGLLVCMKVGGLGGELETPLREVHTLKGTAANYGLKEVSAIAEQLEEQIRQKIESKDALLDEEARGFLDLLAEIEALVFKARMNSDHSLDVSTFVEESFDILQIDHSPPDDASANADTAEEDAFGIDAEMLEIFVMEAEDLLKNIEASIAALKKDPDDREALWEIRRNAHTFKGAAGIVGLKKPSELAHRVEDLLDHLAENEIGANREIIELLLSSTDCLKSITAGENTPQLFAKISQVYKDFDGVMQSLKGEPDKSAAEPVVIKTTSVAPASETKEAALTKSDQPRAIVRVSLARLDELVRIVRDLVVNRSVFEQRLSDFELQIQELHNSTRRLQSTSLKLDIDFEASMFADGQREPGPNLQAFALPGLQTAAPSEFDALEFDQYSEFHQTTRELAETTSDTFAINTALDLVKENLESVFDQQRHLIEEIQEKLMRIRMVTFGTLATRLQRAVQVTCDEEGKKADVLIENQTLEVDTQIIDALIEPLMHLLRNAVVHGIEMPDTRRFLGKPETGKIIVRLINEETHIVLQVADDGRGITGSALKEKAVTTGLISREAADALTNDEVLDLIFVPGLTTAEKLNMSAGRGVGMSIVKQSVEARQGTVSISSSPQKGTTFSVRMPLPFLLKNPKKFVVNLAEAAPEHEGISVLVVDDSPSVRHMTSKIIEGAGWTVLTAKDGVEALEILQSSRVLPSVILTDVEMPRMDGYELVSSINQSENLSHLPIIFITSRSGEKHRERAAELGVPDYITKPFDEKDLVGLIKRLAEARVSKGGTSNAHH